MSGDDDFGEKTDLTRIEDLSEFLHQDDPELDAQLDSPSGSDQDDTPPPFEDLSSLNDLEDDTVEDSFTSGDDLDEDDQFGSFEDGASDFDEQTQSDMDLDFSAQDDDEENIEDENEFPSFESDDEKEDSLADFSTEDEEDQEDDSESFSDQDDRDFNSFSDEGDEEENEDDEDDFSSFNEDENEDFTQDNSLPEQEENEEEPLEQSFSASPSQDSEEIIQQQVSPAPMTRTYIDKSEKFEDVKKFAQNITYGKIAHGGNPAYSIILRNIKFEEDADDIMILLNEHGLVDAENEQAMKNSIEGGSLLISQISEFAAIYLTHKFRRFELDIQMGLSDELHPSKSYERDSVGLVSKYRTNQNKSENVRLEKAKVEIDSVILTTTPSLEDYKILEYLGVISEFTIVTQEELTADSQLSQAHAREAKGHLDSLSSNDLDEESIPELSLGHSDVYNDLLERLKPNCIKLDANAVVGINFQITPINNGDQYKITCSGSAVWVMDLN